MLRFVLTRLTLVVPTFIGITLLAFFLIRLVPGDPIETMAGERGIDQARHEQLRGEYGLDKPVRREVIDFKLSPFGRHTFYGVDIR